MYTKILFVSDAHYGLKSAGFDRTEEVHKIMIGLVDYVEKNDIDIFIHGGDLGHIANPSSQIHGLWIDLFNRLEDSGTLSYFLLGNHDVTNIGSEYGSLAPLYELGLASVKPIVKPSFILPDDAMVNLLFLPYNSRNHLGRTIDEASNDIVDFAKGNHNVLVFTHLNPVGAEVNDDFILRPVSAVVPESIKELSPLGIFSGHIHKPQKIATNHWIVGSPICTDFGDVTDKRFLVIEVDQDYINVDSIPTNCTPLVKLDYDFVDGEIDFSFDEELVNSAGVKVLVKMTVDQQESVDLDSWVTALDRAGAAFVRPITPIIVKRTETETKSKIVQPGLDDKTIVRQWVEEKKPTNSGLVLECAMGAMENG
jgi:DNA repair exonuclease SbcCD nuclease subunit